MALVLEDWEIWLRWQSAFQAAKASIEMHPALPQDHERHQALTTAIGGRLRADRARAKYLKARFESAPNGDLLVEWRRDRMMLTGTIVHNKIDTTSPKNG